MSSTLGNVASPLGKFLISHTASGTSVSHEVHVTATAPTVYDVTADVSGTTAVYVKISEADQAGNGVDTNIPDMKLYFPSGTKTSYVIGRGIGIADGLSFWVSETQANGSAQTAPTSSVSVKIVAD